jgi:hypothetical protein
LHFSYAQAAETPVGQTRATIDTVQTIDRGGVWSAYATAAGDSSIPCFAGSGGLWLWVMNHQIARRTMTTIRTIAHVGKPLALGAAAAARLAAELAAVLAALAAVLAAELAALEAAVVAV